MEKDIFERTERLLGSDLMEHIHNTRVIIFGVGGVGSWCAESLVRSGISQLTIVDSDCVCTSNINRQLMATTKTVGQPKVSALQLRLNDINPDAQIVTKFQMFTADTASSFNLNEYDYVVDAIDSLENKALLIRQACESSAKLFSSMGAALKMNPEKIAVTEFWKVNGCPLAAALRRKFKKTGLFPKKKFQCVFSNELLTNMGVDVKPSAMNTSGQSTWDSKKARINGTVAHITAIFGFTLAGLIIEDIMKRKE
jgi:tRNA A37 threonylcarbamoyladenosine dehydratase